MLSPLAMSSNTDTNPVRLRCLGGGVAPAEMLEQSSRVDKLTDGALANLWPVLHACVVRPMTTELGTELSKFALRYEMAEADLGHVIKISRWLLRSAASLALPKEAFAEDLQTVWSDPGKLGEVLLEHYDAVVSELRQQLLAEALVRHGNVLVDVDWRIDQVTAERSAPKLQLPVALITLAYRGQDRSARLTLQVTADKLARLSQIFGALAQNVRTLAQPDDQSS